MGHISYNYYFLLKWKQETDATFASIKDAVGNSSHHNIKNWLGEGPAQDKMRQKGEEVKPVAMNVESICKFCNTFHVPLERFFIEEGEKELVGVADMEKRPAVNHGNSDDDVKMIRYELKMTKDCLKAKEETISSQRTAIESLQRENQQLRKLLATAEKNSDWMMLQQGDALRH